MRTLCCHLASKVIKRYCRGQTKPLSEFLGWAWYDSNTCSARLLLWQPVKGWNQTNWFTFSTRKFWLQTYFWQTCYCEFSCSWPWGGGPANLAGIRGCLRDTLGGCYLHHLCLVGGHHNCLLVWDYDLWTSVLTPHPFSSTVGRC